MEYLLNQNEDVLSKSFGNKLNFGNDKNATKILWNYYQKIGINRTTFSWYYIYFLDTEFFTFFEIFFFRK